MTIDWVSFLLGLGIGMALSNLISAISASINLRRAKANLKKITDKIEGIKNG